MTLDIHININENKASTTYPALFFSEELHDIIFDKDKKITKWMERFEQFYRLKNYYSDTFYIGYDLYRLNEELNIIAEQTNNSALKEFAIEFSSVCVNAIEQGFNVYCFCD